MTLFIIRVVFFFFLLCLDSLAKQVIAEKSDGDVSVLVNKYFDERQLTLKDDERDFIQNHFNYFRLEDLFFPRGDFDPLPEKWYEYSNILKRENKRKSVISFLPYLVSFFSSIKKTSGNILLSKTVHDIDMLDKKSPFDKIIAEIAKIVDARRGVPLSNVEDVSLYNLIFLFRLLNAINNREDIEEVLECNSGLLSDRNIMEELFFLLTSMQDDSDFLLHFAGNIEFLQQCGLHRGEYDCYNAGGRFEYIEDVDGEWNGWFFNNSRVEKKLDFNRTPFLTETKYYPFEVKINPLHWFFWLLSRQLGDPGLLEFVDRWQIDNNLLFLLLLFLDIPETDSLIVRTIRLLYSYFRAVFTVKFCVNLISFMKRRFNIDLKKLSKIVYALKILCPLIYSGVRSFTEIVNYIRSCMESLREFLQKRCCLDILFFLGLILLFYVYIYIFVFRLRDVLKIYLERICNILFANDILRIRRYVRNMRDFYLTIRYKNENIKSLFIKYLPQSSSIFDIEISKNESLNDEQKELFDFIFSDKEIKEKDMFRFYYLFDKYREMFAKLIVETQYVGSYVIAAVLVNSGKFCIPRFKYSGKNYIGMKDVVHPGIIDVAVKNSFELGEEETGIRNMVFSGSNGTGKTTFQFAVVDNVILAQSLGIACCTEYSATPFDVVISMSNARTDLSKGLSGYTSEVEMVKDCILYLSKNKDKRILLISDEPLSTTDPVFADWLVELIFRRVFSYPNVTSIVATHFNSPREIARKYKHLHVDNFRFKIEDKGTSLENFHLLERGDGYNIGKVIAKQRGLLDLLDVNE